MQALPYIILVLLCIVDNSAAAMLPGVAALFIGRLLLPQAAPRSQSLIYLSFVASLYFIVAFIISGSFDSNKYFIVYDSMNYIQNNINVLHYPIHLETIQDCFLDFADNNGLYNLLIADYSCYANLQLGGTTVFSLTIMQTAFGILNSIVVYRILLKCADSTKAYKYALSYSIFSFVLFYSSVIIRDIVIAFFYSLAIDVLFSRFSIKNVIVLLLCILLSWGVRLYSGIFLISFLFVYIYINIKNRSLKRVLIGIAIIVGLISMGEMLTNSLISQTGEELQVYTELSKQNSGQNGFVSKLMSLPFGVKQIALLLFTMIKLLPPLSMYEGMQSFSNFFSASIYTGNFLYWYVIFYLTMIGFTIRKGYKFLSDNDVFLLGLTFLFLFVNTAHADIRRMMPIYPVLYMYYVRMRNHDVLNSNIIKIWQQRLLIFYFLLGAMLTKF